MNYGFCLAITGKKPMQGGSSWVLGSAWLLLLIYCFRIRSTSKLARTASKRSRTAYATDGLSQLHAQSHCCQGVIARWHWEKRPLHLLHLNRCSVRHNLTGRQQQTQPAILLISRKQTRHIKTFPRKDLAACGNFVSGLLSARRKKGEILTWSTKWNKTEIGEILMWS